MKRINPLILSALFGAAFASAAIYWAAKDGVAQAAVEAAAVPAQRAVFQVDALACGSCEGKIQKALEVSPGVTAVSFNLEERTVSVEYREGATDPKALGEAITRTGFPARFVALAPPAPASADAKTATAKAGGCGGGCCAN